MKQHNLSRLLYLDLPLLLAILILCFIGLIILYSASGQNTGLLYEQGVKIIIALIAMIVVAQFPPLKIAAWAVWLYALGIILLVLVIVYGDVGKGAQRWLDFKILRFQPSELMKLLVPMFIAFYFHDKRLPVHLGHMLIATLIIVVPVLLIAKQPDLGTALLVMTSGFLILFISGMSWRLLAFIGILITVNAPVVWYLMRDYQRQRILTFLNPENDPLGSGYHTIQSSISIGSGGLYGKGWQNGTQSQLDFLPERATDFIFAVFCEEFGMLGAFLLLSIYLFIILRGLYIAINVQHTYGRLLASGITMIFFFHVFVNIGMVTGQLPVVGVPLPFISHGGTALVTSMVSFGILMAIHTHKRFLSF